MDLFKKFVGGTLIFTVILGLTFGTIPYVLFESLTTDPALSAGISIMLALAGGQAFVYAINKDKYKSKEKKRWNNIFWTAILIPIIGIVALFPYIATATIESREEETVAIPHGTRYEELWYMDKGETRKEEGEDGKEAVTYLVKRRMLGRDEVSRKIIDEEIINEPIDEVVYTGTWEEEEDEYYEDENEYYGPTAICGDGTYSYSTGRGTCSHHGGVAQWL